MIVNNVINFQEVKQKYNKSHASDVAKVGDYAHDFARTTLAYMWDNFDESYFRTNFKQDESLLVLMTTCAVMLTECIECFLLLKEGITNEKKKYLRNSLYHMFIKHLEQIRRIKHEE